MHATAAPDRHIERILWVVTAVLCLPIVGVAHLFFLQPPSTLLGMLVAAATGGIIILSLVVTAREVWFVLGALLVNHQPDPQPDVQAIRGVLAMELAEQGHFGPLSNGPTVEVLYTRTTRRWQLRPGFVLTANGQPLPISPARRPALLGAMTGAPGSAWKLMRLRGQEAFQVDAPALSAHDRLRLRAQMEATP